MEAPSINSLVLYYQNTGLGLAEILKILSPRIYNYPKSKYRSSEDDCGEFYLYFYPRLLRTLSRFRDQGKPFDWYFNSVMRWHYREYCQRKLKSEARWELSRSPCFWLLSDYAPPLLGATFQSDKFKTARLKKTDRKRILFLALKNARSLNDSMVPLVSRLTGVHEEKLIEMVEKLQEKLCTKEVRLHKLYLRRNRTFCRILALQRDLLGQTDAGQRAETAVKLAGLQERLHSTQSKIRRVNLRPSNREIAELLEVPKGTVDTSLYWLRNRWNAGRLAA